MNRPRALRLLSLAAVILVASCTPVPRAHDDGPPPCYAWDLIQRCDGWVTPVPPRSFRRTMPYDLYLDPDGFYEKFSGDRVVGAGEFWIVCAGTGNCWDDTVGLLSDAGWEWRLAMRDLDCTASTVTPFPPPPIVVPGGPAPPPAPPPASDGVTKQPPRRERETEQSPVRRKVIRPVGKDPAPAAPDTVAPQKPEEKKPKSSGRYR